ncbi:hypothetical protein [Fibrella forsythiae]|uniref:Transposase n=1 Tax=Fibrella forsythiae TaxID=2817061 RepID=A0ABS3JAF7_9BACT|nr:hypothetical protein [Fibrella forsythiae]MBO0946984.1 hypothetical protein [Fibrella forsythiae]
MIKHYPITLQLTPGEFAALYQFVQLFADRLVNLSEDELWNADLILGDFWKRQFTYGRVLAWSKKPAAKRHKLAIGLLYARLLHTHMQLKPINSLQQNVLLQLDQALKS